MFKKGSCSLQKSGKQFKESTQKKVTPKNPSVPSSPISPGGTKRGSSFSGPRWETSPFHAPYLPRNYKSITRKERVGTTSVLYFVEHMSKILSSPLQKESLPEGSQQVPAPPATAAHLLLQRPSHNSTAKIVMHKLCLHIRLMVLYRELALPKTQSSAPSSVTYSLDTGWGNPPRLRIKPTTLSPKRSKFPIRAAANSGSQQEESFLKRYNPGFLC